MERIQIFKRLKGLLFFMIFGLISFLFGMTMLISSLKFGFKTEFLGGDWNYVFYTLQGIIFFTLGHSSKKYEKYFIEWDNKELKYFLPKNKTEEIVVISDIKGLSINLYEIKILLPEAEKTLSLENVQYKELRRIKEKFEEIRLNIEKR